MARTLAQIQEEMLTAKDNQAHLAGLNDNNTVDTLFQRIWNYFFNNNRSSSKVAIWRLWVYIVSFCIWTLETIFDTHSNDVDKRLSGLKPHTPRWYRNMALAFQYGFDLLEDSPFFDNGNKTDAEIEASKVIKYSAVTELEAESRLIIKIATETGDILSPVNTEQLNNFKAYIAEVKDAGVSVTIINYLPDRLRLNMRLVRDALVLDSNGMNRQEGNFPVNEVINEFLKNLPFNGQLSIQKLEQKILEVPGVNDLSIDLAETSWIDPTVTNTDGTAAYGQWIPIDLSAIPVSGYFTINLEEENDTKSMLDYE